MPSPTNAGTAPSPHSGSGEPTTPTVTKPATAISPAIAHRSNRQPVR